MNRLTTSLALLTAMCLSGCQTPGRIITPDGPGPGALIAKKADGSRPVWDTVSNAKSEFLGAEHDALPTAGAAPDNIRSRLMLSKGFSLIKIVCQHYFSEAGDAQSGLNTGHDVTVATATFVAAAMGLNPRNAKPLAALPILTGGIYSGMDVYARNYLYSAENISAVGKLVSAALDKHRDESLAQVEALVQAGHTLDYNGVVSILQENQDYCRPINILPLVRDAIANGKLEASSSFKPPAPADKRTAAEQAADAVLFKEIGTLFSLQGPISSDQALGYYWLYLHDSTATERKTAIHGLLADMPALAQPLDTAGAAAATFQKPPTLEAKLGALSPPSKAVFISAIEAYRAKVEEKRKMEAEAPTAQGERKSFLARRLAAIPSTGIPLPRAIPVGDVATLPTSVTVTVAK